ncbi:helix-turn-helix domain-containing protein [Streptomyces olivochromogenes]|uniref:Uncharacterized protein n=1 Tax=Streptomyces olivochromogenes TaxID=1963 RepID=A0A250VSR7_STROL|nr:helix-turn-helix domain-containing protein [Streptomyces olivochromogenes]KUN38295.1 hypothetical protein AQJ27_45170 [Streptomyces olivochromogenes]GAX57257.1 hypothetical protein SO3561_08827 [Streptomyces olivochromogenes]
MTAPVQVGPSPSGDGPVPSPDWEDVLADLGDRIRAERQARSWSEPRLATRAGLGRTAIQRLEAGGGTLRVFAQACFALEVDMAYMLSREWRMPARRVPLTARQAELLGAVTGGRTLSEAASELGIPREGLAARLSKIYTQLGLSDVPKDERRAAALRIAVQHGLVDAA